MFESFLSSLVVRYMVAFMDAPCPIFLYLGR